MASRTDITVDQGSTFSFAFNVNDDSNVPIDLVAGSYTSRAQMRRYYTSTNSVAFTTGISNTNLVTLSLDANTTANLISGRYVYDCEIIDSSNNVTRVIEGVATVTPEVTR